MRNRNSRNGSKAVSDAVSAAGLGSRAIETGGQEGRVARILVGAVPVFAVVTFEQQPGDGPVTYMQAATYREDYARDSRRDLGIRATGDAIRLPLPAAQFMLDLAHKGGFLPGGEDALELARSFGQESN